MAKRQSTEIDLGEFMGLAGGGGVQGPRENVTLEAMRDVQQDTAKELGAERMTSKEGFMAQMQKTGNPFASKMSKGRKSAKARFAKVQKSMMATEKAKRMMPLKQVRNTAQKYEQRNPELKGKMLMLLREYVKPDDSPEDILRKVQEFYDDVALADEALEFLEETSEGQTNVNMKLAKEDLNQTHGREVRAGRNMGAMAREAADSGLGEPTSLRDLYRDITGTPREANALFSELSDKWAYKELNKVIKFLMHSLGADLKSTGPSIPRGLLHRLMSEARTLQAILGVYKFFKGRMGLMGKQFAKFGLKMPGNLDFEKMAKEFMSFVGDRYPSSDKAMQSAGRLGIDKWIAAKIIALSQLRDAIREVAMGKIFKSLQHRDDCYMALIEALEDLEDELEELLERQAEEEYEQDDEEDEDEAY